MNQQNFTEKYADRVVTDDMLADLIPGFLKNKSNDLIVLNQALANKDLDQFKKIGHKWKGACSSYGFHYLSEVGQQFEALAAESKYDKLNSLLQSLDIYLANIEVDFDPNPSPDSDKLQ